MSSRRLGLVLVVVGFVGLATLPVLETAAPWQSAAGRASTYAPGRTGWMGSMHAWMHGQGPGGPVAADPSPGAEEVRVTAGDFSFSPSVVRVPAGGTVNLVLVNDGALPHDVTIPDLGFSLPVAPGTSASAALSVTRSGNYRFFCSVPGHREAGMTGLLEVG